MSFSAAILIYDGLDVLELAGPYNVLARATRPGTSEQPLFHIHTVARTKDTVICHGGLQLVPEHIYPDAHIYDAIFVPGGPGYQEAMANLRLVNWINRAARLARVVAASGTGAFLLAAAHLLDDQSAAAVAGLAEAFPAVQPVTDSSVVISGKMLTSGGPAFGEALGQAIIARC
jgi:transcriptional regulator GlxA family with amidase domain